MGASGRHPYPARRVDVLAGSDGVPCEVEGRPVASVRESWLVEEGWWTADPLRRMYFELVTTNGENLTVFRTLPEGLWFAQRA